MSGEGNPNHDPSNGQFSSGGGSSGGGVGKTPRKLRTAKRSAAKAPPPPKGDLDSPASYQRSTTPRPPAGTGGTADQAQAEVERKDAVARAIAKNPALGVKPPIGGVHGTMNDPAIQTLMAKPPIRGDQLHRDANAVQQTAKAQAAKVAPTKVGKQSLAPTNVGIGGAGGSSVGPREARKQRTARRAYFEQMANASKNAKSKGK